VRPCLSLEVTDLAGMTLSSRDVHAMRTIVEACGSDAAAPGLPGPALNAFRALIRCDTVDVSGADWWVLGHYLEQTSSDEDEQTRTRSAERFDGCNNMFWRCFWSLPCSRPERTGVYGTAMKISDVMSLRQLRSDRFFAPNLIESGFQREMLAAWPDGAGRSVHLILRRAPGPDFSERDRFLVSLLRPHLAAAYWTSTSGTSNAKLTARQQEILQLVARGMSNGEIARTLTLSAATVRTHLNNIYARLEVTSRTAAVSRVYGATLPAGAIGP
jgi:DNA-binding CsgD family transcriptional regulator